eukprot:TRINITY_DN15271_c1_g1_i2.p1 TRINITY_DN15271_c1_g1~~TRINITY_DN15271_c1_g1_i2.p1  ORF type:complete len:159 (-),score=45.11 TRINITY_DN15271_c1_g1_i2:444-872(-)
MAAEAEAARNARAKVIAAEGEYKASKSLRQAAEVIMDSPAALQLRYLQTLNSISAEHNSTIIFPVPIDIISNFMQFQQPNNMDVPPQQQQQQQQQSYQQYQQFQQFQQAMQMQQKGPSMQAPGGEVEDCSLKHLVGTDLPVN